MHGNCKNNCDQFIATGCFGCRGKLKRTVRDTTL